MQCPLCLIESNKLIRWNYREEAARVVCDVGCSACKGSADAKNGSGRLDKRIVHCMPKGQAYAISAAHRDDIFEREATPEQEVAVPLNEIDIEDEGRKVSSRFRGKGQHSTMTSGVWRNKGQVCIKVGK